MSKTDDKKKKLKKIKEKATKSVAKSSGSSAVLAGLQALETQVAALSAELAAAKGAPAEADAPRKKKTAPPVSPLAPAAFPALPKVAGVRFAAHEAGVRYKNRKDVMLVALDQGTSVAGVFTKSSTRAAPVLWCEDLRAAPEAEGPQAILVNSGNANAFTGSNGRQAVEFVAYSVGQTLGICPDAVWMASTGVIGEPLPTDPIANALTALSEKLSEDGAEDAARAIMTTDTFPKGASAVVEIDGVPVTVSGFCKGSGMIAPDMATMLGFVFTDAPVDRGALQYMLSGAADASFNSITVDGDTSTSDTVLLAATGKAPIARISHGDDPRWAILDGAVRQVLTDLATQIVRDGEGATKFVRIDVGGAESDEAARKIGLSIGNSPLVKTAFAGEDPNWGRIVAAVGKSGEAADRDRLSIRFGDITVASNGWVDPTYREEDGAAYMKNAELVVGVDVGVGTGTASVWTCDLTHGYITINADYRS